MKTLPRVTKVETNNLQPGELIHMEFALYNVSYIRGFTSIITFVCAKTIILWLFPNAQKKPVQTIRFILSKLKN